MALGDYRLCDVCECKTYYDAGVEYEQAPKGHALWPGMIPHRVGDWAVICDDCAKTHEVEIRLRAEPLNPTGDA